MGDSKKVDVVVVGGGPAGIGAACGASSMGRTVALIERHPILGGMGTAALVNNFCNAHWDGSRRIIGGVFGTLVDRLIARKAIYTFGEDGRFHRAGLPFEIYDPPVFADEAAAMCRDAGADILFGRKLAGVEFTSPQSATVELDDGTVISARTVVDATGDAVVAAIAGVPSNFGRAGDHAVMPLSFCYLIGGIDLDEARQHWPKTVLHDDLLNEDYYFLGGYHRGAMEKIAAARKAGTLTIPRDHISAIYGIPGRPGVASVNYSRVNVKDPTDPAQLAEAEKIGRGQIEEGIRFFRENLPGLANIELLEVARQIGVRESRQIQGLYTLTGQDVSAARQFEDVVAQCRYPIDIHQPGVDTTILTGLPDGQHYDIPWRCLIPREGPPNLIVGGRCISADNVAMSSFRVSPSVMALGEAAGVTAALASMNGCQVASVGAAAVQERLRATGAILA